MANLYFRASYFKAHNEAWDGFSEQLELLHGSALAARPRGAAVTASLLLNWVAAFNQAADLLEEPLLKRGADQTELVGDLLEESCRLYLATEAANAAEANRILSEGY